MLARTGAMLLLAFGLRLPGAAAASADWTIAVYLDGDNDLEAYALQDLGELAAVGSTERVRVVVLADLTGPKSTRRGEVAKGTAGSAWESLAEMPEADMGSPATVTAFIRYARESFPSTHLALILWDHGNGWLPGADPSATDADARDGKAVRAVCQDSTQGTVLSVADVREGILAAGAPVDILGFDACLMGMIEIAHEMAACADIMVASEKTVPLEGWNYRLALDAFGAAPDAAPRQAAALFVDAYRREYLGDEPLAAFDLGALGACVGAFAASLEHVLPPAGDAALRNVVEACMESAAFDTLGYWDFGLFLEALAARTDEQAWREDLDTALAGYYEARIGLAEEVWPPATGLTIYIPPPGTAPLASYTAATLLFAADTRWPEVLAAAADLPVRDDAYAPNDTRSQAKEIPTGGELPLRLVTDGDYFLIRTAGAGRFEVVLRSYPEYADLDLFLLNAGGTALAASTTFSGAEVVTWSAAAAETYCVHVDRYSGPATPYSLEVLELVDTADYRLSETEEALLPGDGGELLPIEADDGGTAVALPFSFVFFGAAYTSVNVSANGFLSFGSGVSAYENVPLPTPGPPTGIIAPWWTDLSPTKATTIVASVLNAAPTRVFTVTWNAMGAWDAIGNGGITFQASLYESTNAIVLRYGDTVFDPRFENTRDRGATATVGIQGEGSSAAVLYGYCQRKLQDGLALVFTPAVAGFIRGDANADARLDVSDAIVILMQLFAGRSVVCADASDANDDGKVDIADAIRVLGHLFGNTGPLPAPSPASGADPTADDLGCGGV